jgi:ribosome maturation factor RimP
MNWQDAVEKTVTGLGYELVDCERTPAGTLRVYIDKLPEQVTAGEVIGVDDCERVTRQLQYVLEVEACAYERLEVSSPGLDRPLKKASDYARFVGQEVLLTLKVAFQGKKKYSGVLSAEGEGWRIVFDAVGDVEQAMDFSLEEIKEARLVPVTPFKGRNSGGPAKKASPAGKKPEGAAKKKGPAALGRKTDDKVHGGLDQ